MSEQEPGKKGNTALKERPQTRRPPMWKVILHNDDYTTQEWVVYVLKEYLHKDHAEAVRLMFTVHHNGHAIVGLYSRDIAETKVAQITDASRSEGYPLLCTCEPED